MFDMSQIAEKISGLFEQSGVHAESLPGGLAELAQSANIDLSALESAPIEQLTTLLSQAGIDPTGLADSQIIETAQDLVQKGALENLDLSQLLNSTDKQ